MKPGDLQPRKGATLETELRPSLRGAFAGWLEPAKGGRPSPRISIREQGPEFFLLAENLAVRVAADRVRWHVDASVLTLVAGEPHLAGKPASAKAIHALLSGQGEAAVTLRGRFSVVQIDAAHGSLSLITDRFATHSLCWTVDASRFGFAERADEVPTGQDKKIDPQAVFNYLYFHVIPAPRTIFSDVARLEGSRILHWAGRGQANVRPTWRPNFKPESQATGAELAPRFRALVQRAVERECTTPRIGAFLSGGTDSSTVAGMLCRVVGVGAPTFSIGFDAKGYDEVAYARISARHFGTEHFEHYVTPADLVAGIPRVATHFDQPFGNSSAVPAYLCARMAAEQGIRKLLAGDGGDELFGGNTRYAKQKIFEWYWRLPKGMRSHLIEPILASPEVGRLPLLGKASSYVRQARISMPQRTETYNLLTRFGVAAVLASPFGCSIDTEEPRHLQQSVYDSLTDAQFVDRMLAYDWRFTLIDNDLPKVIGATSLAGIDVGFPLLDEDLLDFSIELGADNKVHGLKLRYFFKNALADFLPPATLTKKKHGFGLPVGPWLLTDTPFRELARSSLAGLVERRLIRPQLVDDLFSNRLTEHAGYFGEMVWILMMLEQWLRASAPTFVFPTDD